MSRYTTIQIKKETRDELQEYCKKHGYKMSSLIEILIHERIKPIKIGNVLRVSATDTRG
jgi:hypothetical protein